MSKKSEPVVVESVNSVDNSVEVLQAKIAAMRKAQEKFASYTQEQVDRIFLSRRWRRTRSESHWRNSRARRPAWASWRTR